MSADSNQKSTDLIGIVNLRPRIRPKDPELLKQYMEQYHKNYYHKRIKVTKFENLKAELIVQVQKIDSTKIDKINRSVQIKLRNMLSYLKEFNGDVDQSEEILSPTEADSPLAENAN